MHSHNQEACHFCGHLHKTNEGHIWDDVRSEDFQWAWYKYTGTCKTLPKNWAVGLLRFLS